MERMHDPGAGKAGRPPFRSRAEISRLLQEALRGERRALRRPEALAALRRAGYGGLSLDAPLWLHEFSFSARPADVSWARRRVTEFAADCDLAGAELYDLGLAAGEALGNAVEHGSPNGDLDIVHVRVGLLRRSVAVEIVDQGLGFDASLTRALRAEGTRGRGLPFMRGLLDELRIEAAPHGTRVLLVKHL